MSFDSDKRGQEDSRRPTSSDPLTGRDELDEVSLSREPEQVTKDSEALQSLLTRPRADTSTRVGFQDDPLTKTISPSVEDDATKDESLAYPETILIKTAPYPKLQRQNVPRQGQTISVVEAAGGRSDGQFPPRTRTLQYARTLSIRPTDTNRSLQRQRTLERQVTVSLATGPSKGDSAARAVAEFRTLSIHVSDTQRAAKEKAQAAKDKVDVSDLVNLDYHTVSADELLQRLTVSRKSGLDSEQATRRLQQNGKNMITPPPKNWLKKVATWILGGFGTLLLGGSVLAFISWKPLGNPDPQASNLALAVVLLLVLVLQGLFNAWQDYSTGRTMASITGMLPTDVLVLRDGMEKIVNAEDLVTGDIVRLRLGDKVPADVRFIEVSSDLKLDRAVLTGESEPIPASINSTDGNFLETRNIGLQGTLCVSGGGWGVVVQTGDNTVFGRIAKLSSGDRTAPTTLQVEISRFVKVIATLATTIAVIVIIFWAAFLNRKHKGFVSNSTLVIDVVSVMVAFIPEGLPFAVTLSMSIIAGRLAANKVLCKSLPIVESLGCVSVLCSDKTGTLTQNKMTVVNFCILDTQYGTLEGRDVMRQPSPQAGPVAQMAAVAGICNGATFDPTTMDQPIETRLVNGDATDSAILRFAEFLRPVKESASDFVEIFKQAFNSKTKYMLKIMSPVNSANLPAPICEFDDFGPDDLVLMCKGAPDVLLARCSFIIDADGKHLPFDESARQRLIAKQEEWASKGQRVLLLSRKIIRRSDVPKELPMDSPEFSDFVGCDLNRNLTIVGLVGLVDPPKEDVPAAVATIRQAGCRFFMVTGDFALTAVAIAEQIGIVSDSRTIHRFEDLDPNIDNERVIKFDIDKLPDIPTALVLTGNDLMKMNDSQWEQACAHEEIVFARTTPEQKLRIVKEFQARHNVTAMTGDGVNDSPSLKAADVGLAVGSQASDVAIEAADLVLLESFESIISGLEYGRLVFDNLKKSIIYLLPAGSFSELMPVLLNFFIGLPQTMSNIQMLLVCCFSDLFCSIALCYEKPEEGLLLRRPRDVRKDRLVDWKLMLQAYGTGILECMWASAMAFWYLQRQGIPFSALAVKYGTWGNNLSPDFVAEKVNTAQTIYYFQLVVLQLGNAMAIRTRRLSIFQHPPFFNRATSNYSLAIGMPSALAVTFFFIYVPVWQNVFLTRDVPVEYIFLPFAGAFGLLLLDETRKYCVRTWPNGLAAKMAW